jgi:hypothetical protein
MTRPRKATAEQLAAAQAALDGFASAAHRTCRPGIRGRCGDSTCEFCQRADAVEPTEPEGSP